MKTKLYQDKSSLSIDREEWNSLLSYCETDTPFQTYEWFCSWWEVFGGKHNLFIITAHSDNGLIGIAPLMISYHERRSGVVRFIADEKSDYCDFIIRNQKIAFIGSVFDCLLEHVNLWSVIDLRNIPEQSSTLPIIRKICHDRDIHYLNSTSVCPTLIVSKCNNIRSLAAPKSLKRHINYFKKSGKLSFRVLDSVENKLNALDVFFEQHIQRRSITKAKSLFLNPLNKIFYREIVNKTANTDWLFFSCLEHNGLPIAFHFGFDYNSKVIWYKPSFDISFKKRSPGRLMIKFLIEYCVENKKNELDFTLGDEVFKQYYSNTNTNIISLKIYRKKINYIKNLFIHSSKSIIKNMFRNFDSGN